MCAYRWSHVLGPCWKHLLSLNELRCHFEGIVEESGRDVDALEESATQPIVSVIRVGEVGRPWLELAQEQLETLHVEAGFRWADVARILGISERTICRSRHEFWFPVGQDVEFTFATKSLTTLFAKYFDLHKALVDVLLKVDWVTEDFVFREDA